MKTNDISLISSAVLQAARPAAATAAAAQGHTVQFQATVTAAEPPATGSNQWQLTLSDGQRSLTVSSDRPFPAGTQLTLSATLEQPPVVKITAAQLPVTDSLLSANSAVATTPSLTTPVQTSGTRTQLHNLASQLREAPLPQAVKELLASRIRFANPTAPSPAATAALTYASPGPAKAAGAFSANNPQAAPVATPGSPRTAGPVPAMAQSAPLMPPTGAIVTRQPQIAVNISSSPLPLLQLLQTQVQTLPAPLRSSISEFISRLPTSGQLATTNGLRNAVDAAPVSFERSLLHPQMPAGQSVDSTTALFRQLWRPLNTPLPATVARESSTPVSAELQSNAAPSSMPTSVSGLKSLIQQFARLAGTPAENPATPITAQLPTEIPLPAATGHNVKALILHLLRHWPATDAAVTASLASGMPAAEDAIPEMFRLLQQAASQIEHEQVRLLQAQEPAPTTIPLLWRQGDQAQQAQMNFADGQGKQEATAQKRQRWQLTLHFDLQNLGPLDVELDLMPPAVSATFWSEHSTTLSALNTALVPLRQSLRDLGAEVGELQARHGRRPLQEQPLIRHSLVDIHT